MAFPSILVRMFSHIDPENKQGTGTELWGASIDTLRELCMLSIEAKEKDSKLSSIIELNEIHLTASLEGRETMKNSKPRA